MDIKKNMTPRLLAVASFVEQNSTVADVGTDHAYIPVWLVKNGIATTTILGLVPSISLTYALNKLCKIKNNILKSIVFIFTFYVLTYLMTIIYRDGSFIDSFYIHLKEIVNAIPNILESITKHANIEWVEGE